MTADPVGEILSMLVRVALQAEDREYIVGALTERVDQAGRRGEIYSIDDFVRDALIEAAHR